MIPSPRPAGVRNRSGRMLPIPTGYALVLVAVGMSVTLALVVKRDFAHVLTPALTMLCMALLYLVVIHRREGNLPVFEAATLWVAALVVYGVYPLVNYMAAGLNWTPLSDSRLLSREEDTWAVAQMGWRYATYMIAFLLVYLPARTKRRIRGTVDDPGVARTAAMVILFATITLFLFAVGMIYGVVFSASYADLTAGNVKSYATLPHHLLQIVHNLVGIRFFVVQTIVAVLVLQWQRISVRVLLLVIILSLGIYTAAIRTARTDLVLLILAAGLLYHRMVRPISIRFAVPGAVAFLSMFLILGFFRDIAADDPDLATTPALARMNEFQAIFATGYDVHERRVRGELREEDIPWQVRYSDFIALVPSQFLPFEKIDPSNWYLQIGGYEGVGLMFGAVAQSVLGGDWVELAVRGALMGLFCALLHRWYVRRASSFWRTMFYMFVMVWMYYSIRLTSFAFLYFILYRFVPTLIAVELGRVLLSKLARGERGAAGAGDELHA